MLNNYSVNDGPYAKWCLLIVSLQLYHKVCIFVIPFLASHIDTTVLADGTYELIPESEGSDQEAQVNAATLSEDPDQSPEEPKADLSKPSISNYALYILLTCAFTVLRI